MHKQLLEALEPLKTGPPARKNDFNTRISPHLLLQRLVLIFGAQLWKEDGIVWGITLKHSISDSWLQIWNWDGHLLVVYEELSTVRTVARNTVFYLVSKDVITPYD